MKQDIDYSAVEFQGYIKSFSANMNHPEGVLLFIMRKSSQASPIDLRLESIILPRELIQVPKTEFEDRLKTLQKKIAEIEGSFEFRKVINFDRTKYDSLTSQYAVMQKLDSKIKEAEPKPVYK